MDTLGIFFMQTDHLRVLIHIRKKGEFGNVKHIKPSNDFLTERFRRCFFCGSFLLFVFVFVILPCLFLAALWSPVGKGLTS